MTVYVDQLPDSGWGKWSGGAHMICSDLDELHRIAKEIGLRRSWFQDSTFPHYDLTRAKRIMAINHGAVQIEWGEIPDDVLMRCKDGSHETHLARKNKWQHKKLLREQRENLQDVQPS